MILGVLGCVMTAVPDMQKSGQIIGGSWLCFRGFSRKRRLLIHLRITHISQLFLV